MRDTFAIRTSVTRVWSPAIHTFHNLFDRKANYITLRVYPVGRLRCCISSLKFLMRWLIAALVVFALLAGGVALAYKPAVEYWEQQNAPKWRTAAVERGTIVSVVNATGTVKPVLQVSVGSFVSGPIDPEYILTDHAGEVMRDKTGQPMHIAEFNQEVKKGDMLAKVQETIYRANVDRDQASLDSREADVERLKALVWQALRDERRAVNLQKENPKFIAQADVDKVTFNRMQLEAQLKLAIAAVKQAEAQLKFSVAQLNYTNIIAPVDGIIINRKIDPGQTLAAQFQTPELFVVAPDMRNKMHVHASVDEADIGLIHEAQRKSLPVTFTVDAYPDDLFAGAIEEIRLSSTTTQNVVTYPVVVAAPNPDLKLLPGMTPSISFEVDRREEVIKIPNSALRFFPQTQHVRDKEKPLLEGRASQQQETEQPAETRLSAEERATTRRKRNRRHVWVQEGPKLRAVEVETGLSDSHFTELITGEIKPTDKLVIGIQPAAGWGG
jgi:HlyD family secretion protein